MKSQAQLVLAAIGLSILIWVYADQQGYKSVTFPIAVTISTPPGLIAHVAGAADGSRETAHVTVIARGPNSAIRELPLSRPPVMEVAVPVTENVIIGEPRSIDIHDSVLSALRERGLQLQNANPTSLTVRFDRLVRMDVQVQLDAGAFHQALAGAVQVDPLMVKATVPASQLTNSDQPLDQKLVIPIEDDLRAQPGETDFEFTISLKNRRLQGMEVKWEPETVTIRGKLQQLYTDLELKLIPLRVLLPWDWPSDKYEIEWVDERDRLQKVELKIPVGKPNVLTNTDVTAFITIDDSLIPPEPSNLLSESTTQPATEPSPFSQTVRFVFPPAFEDVRIVSPPSTVKFRIIRRTQTEAVKTTG